MSFLYPRGKKIAAGKSAVRVQHRTAASSVDTDELKIINKQENWKTPTYVFLNISKLLRNKRELKLIFVDRFALDNINV